MPKATLLPDQQHRRPYRTRHAVGRAPEELFVRGYVITNVTEGLDGVPSVHRSVAAGVGVALSSFVFYVTHSGRGTVFGVMAACLSVLFGLCYVLSGNLSVPIGLHFGVNFSGVLVGTNPQSASLLELKATETVATSLALPVEVVILRLAGAALGVGLVIWWYHATRGSVRIAPTVARPALRWRHSADEHRS